MAQVVGENQESIIGQASRRVRPHYAEGMRLEVLIQAFHKLAECRCLKQRNGASVKHCPRLTSYHQSDVETNN
jgi:hypothetical protein